MTSTQKAEALFDFEPTAEVELKMQRGEVVTVKRMSVGEGWWEGELNGRRGLFPSSFVKLLPVVQEPLPDISPSPPAPLTPRTTKKAFMETMLAPEPSTLDEIYDEERARELFIPGHNVVSIELGPRWKGWPPTLTIVVKEPQTEPRFSGMKHVTLYDVDTKELGSCVPRRYKQFLWLYDRLAENFPCISLPPLPVKQGSGQDRGKDVRRKGLEQFVRKVARHPVLGCTRFLKVFLTEDTKSDKEWKIGRHLSHLGHNIKLPKTPRKLFNAPVYSTVKYPPYNVPIGQLASIEKFSQYSRLLENNVNALHMACQGITMSQRDMVTNINLLAKDLKCFAKGIESTAHRRKLQAKTSVNALPSVPLPPASVQPSLYTAGSSSGDLLGGGGEGGEDSSGGEEGDTCPPPQWNWRDDERFNSLLSQLQELASGLQRTARVFHTHQEAMESEVMESLQEFLGAINTLPGLVRLHEEAMEYYNSSKTKDSKTEAEEVRQNCETLNNILLAEFDYFSNNLVDDFQTMMQRLLHQQSNFHRRMADEWDLLSSRYSEQVSSRLSDTPVHIFSTSPTPPTSRTTSASHPHLHTLHPPSSSPLSQRTPSEVLTSSDGSCSQDDIGYTKPDSLPKYNPTQSQSHPNIHTLGTKTPVHAPSPTIEETDARTDLSSSSGSRTDTATPTTERAESRNTLPRSYVNFDVDELNESTRERRLRSLSPLELSIERELKTKADTVGDEERAGEDNTELHPYANWQFEKMNERTQKVPANTRTKLLLNGVSSGKQREGKPATVLSSPLRKPLKPPSPFRLQNLSDLTTVGSSPPSSSTTSSSRVGHTSSQKVAKLLGVVDGGEDRSVGTKSQGKAQSTHEVSPNDPDAAGQSFVSGASRNANQILPSQLQLRAKPRSYTTSHFLAKKKPILPPGAGGGGARKTQSHMGKQQDGRGGTVGELETLESSGELEKSSEKDSSTHPSPPSRRGTFLSLGREAARGAATKTEKPGSPSSELLRKLSQRRQRLEQQLMVSSGKHTSGSTTASSTGGGDSSSRTSTSSTQSELVCSYNVKRSHDDLSGGSTLADVELRTKEEASLAKYGIVEEGGTFEI